MSRSRPGTRSSTSSSGYKDLEPEKWVKVEGWGDAAEAEAVVQAGLADYQGA